MPRLDNKAHLGGDREELEHCSPKVVLLDPLYLAAGGGRGKDLYAMGESLQAIQVICQEARAALVVNTHWNKGGEGTGAGRFTGVGPGAWGRVLGSAAVEQRHTDPDGRSTVTLLWEFTGGEIPETRFRMRRRVWAEDASRPELADALRGRGHRGGGRGDPRRPLALAGSGAGGA